MINHNDPSVIDYSEISGVDCNGDWHVTEIVLSYDLSEGSYSVEKFVDGKSRDLESFDDRTQAGAFFSIMVKDVTKDYADEKADFERGSDD